MPERQNSTSLGKWNETERIKFLQNLVLLLDNGFSLNEGLRVLPRIWLERSSELVEINAKIGNQVEFADVLAELGFNKTTATQIDMAMKQGTLRVCLVQLTKVLTLKQEQLKRIKGELAYPMVIMTMMFGLFIFMRVFMNEYLPIGATSQLEVIIIFMVVTFLLVLFMSGIYAFYALKKQSYYRLLTTVKFPVIGPLIAIYVKYLVLFNLNILLVNGFSIQEICNYASEQNPDSLQYQVGMRVQRRLLAGDDMDSIIVSEKFLANELQMLVETGSERSVLAKQIKIVELLLFDELTTKMSRLSMRIQPISFIIIGVLILMMYLKFLLPVYSMMQNF